MPKWGDPTGAVCSADWLTGNETPEEIVDAFNVACIAMYRWEISAGKKLGRLQFHLRHPGHPDAGPLPEDVSGTDVRLLICSADPLPDQIE